MSTRIYVDPQIGEGIADLAERLRLAEMDVTELRRMRDQMFVDAYDARAISVTEMGKLSGLRRESVHEAITRTKQRSER